MLATLFCWFHLIHFWRNFIPRSSEFLLQLKHLLSILEAPSTRTEYFILLYISIDLQTLQTFRSFISSILCLLSTVIWQYMIIILLHYLIIHLNSKLIKVLSLFLLYIAKAFIEHFLGLFVHLKYLQPRYLRPLYSRFKPFHNITIIVIELLLDGFTE